MEAARREGTLAESGELQDGGSTDIERVTVEYGRGEITVRRRSAAPIRCRPSETVMSSHMKGVPLRMKLPGGLLLTVEDGDLARAVSRRRAIWISNLEQNFARLFLPLLIGAAIVFWIIIQFVIPPFAGAVAGALPVWTANDLGASFYESMAEDMDFSRDPRLTGLAGTVLDEARPGFEPEEGEEDYDFDFLMLRPQPGLGRAMLYNAFALPNGHIIFGEELHDVLNDEERYMILAHEISHVLRRHSLEAVVRSAVWYVVGAFLTGDVLFVAAPALLAEAGYSRAAEREADCDAALQLQRTGRDPQVIASVFEKLRTPGSISEHELEAMDPEERARVEELKAEIEEMKRERNQGEAGQEQEEGVIISHEEEGHGLLVDLLATHPPIEDRAALVDECLEANG